MREREYHLAYEYRVNIVALADSPLALLGVESHAYRAESSCFSVDSCRDFAAARVNVGRITKGRLGSIHPSYRPAGGRPRYVFILITLYKTVKEVPRERSAVTGDPYLRVAQKC